MNRLRGDGCQESDISNISPTEEIYLDRKLIEINQRINS